MSKDKFEKLDDYVDFFENLVAECYSSQHGKVANPKTELSEEESSIICGFYKYAEANIHIEPQEFAIDKRLIICRSLINQLY